MAMPRETSRSIADAIESHREYASGRDDKNNAMKQLITSMEGQHAANVANIHETGATTREKMKEPLYQAQAKEHTANAEKGIPALASYHSAAGNLTQAKVKGEETASARAGDIIDANLKGIGLDNSTKMAQLIAAGGKIAGGQSMLDAYSKATGTPMTGDLGGFSKQLFSGEGGGDAQIKRNAMIDAASSMDDLRRLQEMHGTGGSGVASPNQSDVGLQATLNPITGKAASFGTQFGTNTAQQDAIATPTVDPTDAIGMGAGAVGKKLLSAGAGAVANSASMTIGGGVAKPELKALASNFGRTAAAPYSRSGSGFASTPWTP